jgi:O-antigen/teichoic acid export membrane protein
MGKEMATKSSIKVNYTLNLLNTVSGLLFPIISFPYVSRILMAEGIGTVQFYQSIIQYIMLGAALGIPLYAVREIARVRDDRRQCAQVAVEIVILHTAITLLSYVVVAILVTCVGRIADGAGLFLLQSSSLLLTVVGTSWFFQGVEDFKYITIRTLVIRILLLLSLFVFVHEKDDIIPYALIHVLGETGNGLVNVVRFRKYLRGTHLSFAELRPLRHLKPALRIFTLNLIISIYVHLDSVMLGFLSGEAAVGFYTPALRLTKTTIGIVSSLGGVLLPRFSNLVKNGQMDDFNRLSDKAIGFVFFLCLPMTIGLIFLAPSIIHFFCGDTFQPSILTLQLLAPINLFIGLSGMIGTHILYPQGREKLIIQAAGAGAVINFIFNCIFIPRYAQYGAACSTAVAEFTVTAILILIGRPYFHFAFRARRNLNYLIGTIVLALWLVLLCYVLNDDMLLILIAIPTSCILYLGYLYRQKDRFVLQIIATGLNQLSKGCSAAKLLGKRKAKGDAVVGVGGGKGVVGDERFVDLEVEEGAESEGAGKAVVGGQHERLGDISCRRLGGKIVDAPDERL